MINVAIIDDNQQIIDLLEQYFKKYTQDKKVTFNVHSFLSAIGFLDNYKSEYDLVLMDIELPGLNGFDAAIKLREIDKLTKLVFVTNMAQYAVKGYEANAFDFIVKPITYQIFSLKMDRILNSINNNSTLKLKIKTKDGIVCIDFNNLKYIEVNAHRLFFYEENNSYEGYGTLKYYEDLLNKYGFIRCNNYDLINLRFVTGIENNCVLINKEKMEITRPRKSSVIRALNNYLGSYN